jgi:hypothetical protein
MLLSYNHKGQALLEHTFKSCMSRAHMSGL